MPKLNQLYHQSLQNHGLSRILSQTSAEDKATIQRLVHAWTEPSLFIYNDLPAFTNILYNLLNRISGIQPKATSPFLSRVSQQPSDLITPLWLSLQHEPSNESLLQLERWVIFCDLWSHHLIALRDVDFLRCYVSPGDTFSAIEVIDKLRDLLFELYWKNPVTTEDLNSSDEGAQAKYRLMLSGTKLWNSLYQRWCRLVRPKPFCPEQKWLFPKLSRMSTAPDVTMVDANEDETEAQLAKAFSDPLLSRILTSIPQAIPFERRVKLFYGLIEAEKLSSLPDREHTLRRLMEEGLFADMNSVGREQVEIHRAQLYEDSKIQLTNLGRRLKRKLQVTFINSAGQQEAGIDGGGILKEFLDDLIRDAFSPSPKEAPQLFDVTPLETLAVKLSGRDLSRDEWNERLAHYEFLGRVLGKALYESILVEPQFSLPFLNQLLGKSNSLEDLKNFDMGFYANLMKLRSMDASQIAELGLTFELNLTRHRSVELIPGGSSIPVTKSTVIQYTHLVAHRRLNVEPKLPTQAFLKGFRDLIPGTWVRLFSAHELQKMISGQEVDGIHTSDLKRTMQYAGGYHPSQPIMKWFWDILQNDFSPSQQQKLLKFMTSCSRQPLLGFESLEPAPCIQQIRLPADEGSSENARLPTSATCMNLLKLPCYASKELLKTKLLQAIESGAGFELT